MIVVDTNVIVYLHIRGVHTDAATALRQRDDQWAAPRIWRSEFRNVLTGYLRRGTLQFDQICALQTRAETLLGKAESEVDSHLVFELVRASSCTAYDCEFVALARQLGTRLVTLDGKLLRAFPQDTLPLTAELS